MTTTTGLLADARHRIAMPGEWLLRRDQVPAQALHLRSGQVAVGVWDGGQMRHWLLTVQAPCWLDAGAVMLRRPCVADWVAHTAVELESLPAQALRDWYLQQPAAARALLSDALNLHSQQTEAALALQTQDAEARCAQWLLRHARRDGEAMTVPMDQPKRAIAAQLGITPETFSRVLRRLRETGLIREEGCTMSLLDAGSLRALAGR